MRIFGKEFFPGSEPAPAMAPARNSIAGQLQTLDEDLAKLGERLERLGLFVSTDGDTILGDAPPVASLSDAVEFVNSRVDVLFSIMDSIEEKLGVIS